MLIAQDRQSLFGIGGPSPSNPCGDRSGAAVLVLSNEDRASLSFESFGGGQRWCVALGRLAR